MAEHARLGPSAAERWIHCPASIQVSERLPDETSTYAEEGTQAHTIAEITAALQHGLISHKDAHAQTGEWMAYVGDGARVTEMIGHAETYADLIGEALQKYPNTVLLLEQRVATGVEQCWGTADAVLVSPEHLHVIDYKYGAGVRVRVQGNPQLRLYAVGALEMFGDVIGLGPDTPITYTVHQPRLEHTESETMTASELRQWRDAVVAPSARAALGPDAHFGPSEAACRFCPAAGECKPRAAHLTKMDFGDPDLLSPEEMAGALQMLPQIKSWVRDIDHAALSRMVNRDEEIPGWKVALSAGRRGIPDSDAAIARLVEAGYSEPLVSRTSVTVKPLGELEKVVGGKAKLANVLDDLIIVSEGKPSVVPEGDPRPEFDRAAAAGRDFAQG